MNNKIATPHKIKMAKTKAQKARARARKNNASIAQGNRGKATRRISGPVNQQVKQKGKKKNRSRQRVRRDKTVTDGLSRGKIYTNNSTIVDPFRMRREKVCNVLNNTTTFSIQQQFYLNPGNTLLHPIFSQIAATYEQYQVKMLRFVYEDRMYTASGSVVGAPKVIMATSFDPDDAPFTNDTQMENYVCATAFPGYTPRVEHDAMAMRKRKARGKLPLNDYFIYSSANGLSPVSGAGKFYDFGNFQLAVLGGSDTTSIIGELFVEYQYELIDPKQQTPLGQNILYAHLVESAAGTASTAAPLGTSGGALRAGSTIPIVSTNTTFTLPFAGTFLVNALFTGSVTVNPTFSPGANISAGPTILKDNTITNDSAVTAGISVFVGMFTVALAGVSASNVVTIGGLTNLASGTADIFVNQVSSAITLSGEVEKKSSSTEKVERLEKKVDLLLSLLASRNPDLFREEEHKIGIKDLELAATDSDSEPYPSAIPVQRRMHRKLRVDEPETLPVQGLFPRVFGNTKAAGGAI